MSFFIFELLNKYESTCFRLIIHSHNFFRLLPVKLSFGEIRGGKLFECSCFFLFIFFWLISLEQYVNNLLNNYTNRINEIGSIDIQNLDNSWVRISLAENWQSTIAIKTLQVGLVNIHECTTGFQIQLEFNSVRFLQKWLHINNTVPPNDWVIYCNINERIDANWVFFTNNLFFRPIFQI